MTMKIKNKGYRVLCTIVLIGFLVACFSIISFADSYSLYGSLSASETIANNMVGLYMNQPDYDPYNEFFVFRNGQYSYLLVYGKNLADSYNYIGYEGQQTGYQINYHYTFGSGDNLSINNNGYVGVGNLEHSIKSDKAEQFKFQYVSIVLLILLVLFVMFKVFRIRVHDRKERGWTY